MAEKLEDLNLPTSVISRLIKDVLPNGVHIGKDVRVAVARSTSVFVLYITACANAIVMEEQRKTLTAADILRALYETEFEFLCEPLMVILEEFKNSKIKKVKSCKTEEVGPSVEHEHCHVDDDLGFTDEAFDPDDAEDSDDEPPSIG